MTIKGLDYSEITHKDIYKNIRNFLAGRFVGATRDRALLEEVVKCFFCKHYIITELIVSDDRSESNLSKLYRKIFNILKKKLPQVFEKSDEIELDPASIQFVDNEFDKIDFKNLKRDPFGDLYEVFVSTGVREEEGQFFTPQNGVELLVSMVSPKVGETILDPAAGAGGFLSYAIRYLIDSGSTSIDSVSKVFGIEKDSYLAKLTATRIAMIGLMEGNIFCGDSLAWVDQKKNFLNINMNEEFDIILTNPPFGKNIISTTKELQKSYELGYEWKLNDQNDYVKTNKLLKNVSPQVLFVEKCINLLKTGGRMGMVVPESLITGKSYSYVVNFIRKKGDIKAVIGMPEDFFKTSGKGGTHTKACLILFIKNSEKIKTDQIFLAEAKWCGHDSRGKSIIKDDLPMIFSNFEKFQRKEKMDEGHLGYLISEKSIENNILSPRYYNPAINIALNSISKTHKILRFGDLVKSGHIEIKTGHEVGKQAYGTGIIPFVRTSDISNWEIKIDPKHGINEEIYAQYSNKQNIEEGDILMVKDGTYLIGTCAMVSKYDTKIVYQSHMYKIRVLNKDLISPNILLASLSSEPVQKQIKSKRFTQDIIDSLGNRIHDLLLPIPKDKKTLATIEKNVSKVISDRIEARELARQACLDVASSLILEDI